MRALSDPLKQFTAQLGHLLSLSRIIDRNQNDADFAEKGGEIVYVFDTNVVQMFLEPYKNPQFCEVFHTPLWGGEREADLDANSQACLIASEYLLSGKLPGQRDGIWYMTDEHHAELQLQEGHLRGHIADNLARMRTDPRFKEQVFDNVARLTEALDIDPNAGRSALEMRAETWRAPWLDELRSLTDKQFRQRATGIRAREVCRILARDDVAEPANQLFRYRSLEVAARFRTLQSLLNPVGDDNKEIKAEVQDWRALLGDVLLRHPANIKTREGFRSDCEALGLISWAARQQKYRDRRFVLVTGDTILLEAYKQRHLEGKPGPDLIRPINQFAPLFNPSSAQSTLASQQYAFLKLRQVLELLLVSINLQLLVAAEPVTRERARDKFILQLQQDIGLATDQVLAAFPQSGDTLWLRQQIEGLEKLVQELRPIERLMLEAFPNLVAPRMQQERLRFEEAVGDGGEALLAAIEKRLVAASEIGAQFSLQTTPGTIDHLFEAFGARKDRQERRATVHARLYFSDGHGGLSYEETVSRFQRLTSKERLVELEAWKGDPAKLFAFAALLGFQLEIWNEAERYSNLAATASLELTKYVERLAEAPAEHFEYDYLMAVALRFRLASFEPIVGQAYSDPWGQWLRRADDTLVDCIDYHSAKGQLTRAIRASGERAAIHVSYCEWFAFGRLAEPGFYADPGSRALDSFRKVATELRACEDLLADAEAHAIVVDAGTVGAQSQTILGSVRRQFRANVHAAIMAARRLKTLWPELREAFEECAERLPEPFFGEVWPDGPLVADAYRAAVQGDLKALDGLADKLSLPLDRAVLEGLRELVAQETR